MANKIALLLILGIAVFAGVNGDSYLTPLAEYVIGLSDPDVVPQQTHGTPINLHIIYSILNIADVDKEHNVIESEALMEIRWDSGISWTPADYGGAEFILLPQKYFWTPTLQQLSSAVRIDDLSPKLVILYNNGTAAHFGSYRFKSLCDLSHVETGSTCNGLTTVYTYDKSEVIIAEIGSQDLDLLRYFPGSHYKITGSTLNVVDREYDGRTYQIIASSLTVQKKPGHDHSPLTRFFEWH